jgi:hypothetical protein
VRFSISVFTSSLPMLVCWIAEGVGGNEGGGGRAVELGGNLCLGDLYAHIVGLRAAWHTASLVVDARVC